MYSAVRGLHRRIAAATQVARHNVSNTHLQDIRRIDRPACDEGADEQQHAEGVEHQVRASGAYVSTTTAVFGRVLGVDVKSSMRNTAGVDSLMMSTPSEPSTTVAHHQRPTNSVPRRRHHHVLPEVHEYRRTAITNVIVSDSLAARFEYVPGARRPIAMHCSRFSQTKSVRRCAMGIHRGPAGARAWRYQLRSARTLSGE